MGAGHGYMHTRELDRTSQRGASSFLITEKLIQGCGLKRVHIWGSSYVSRATSSHDMNVHDDQMP
jgi:hypothetical protein